MLTWGIPLDCKQQTMQMMPTLPMEQQKNDLALMEQIFQLRVVLVLNGLGVKNEAKEPTSPNGKQRHLIMSMRGMLMAQIHIFRI